MEGEHRKFNEVELLLGGFFTLGADFICALIDWTGIGLIIAPFIQTFATFSMWLWFKAKGDQSISIGRQVAKYLANALPFVPTTLIAFVIEAFLHNHPKVAAIAAKAVGPAAKLAGPIKKAA